MDRKKTVLVVLAVFIVFYTPNFVYGASDLNSETNTTILEPIQSLYNTTINQTSTLTNLVKPLVAIDLIIKSVNTTILKNNTSDGNNISINSAGPDENQVNTEFNEIQKIPYNEKSMNCQVKSELFADYLSKNGAKQIYLVVIEHDSGKYSHEFVEWNDHYYDPCNDEISYNLSKTEYLDQLHKLGFNGMIITSPYTS